MGIRRFRRGRFLRWTGGRFGRGRLRGAFGCGGDSRLFLHLDFLHGKQDENVFQAIEANGGLHLDDLKRISRSGAFDGADGNALGEDAVEAGRDDLIAGLDLFIVGDVIHARIRVAHALDDSLGAGDEEESADGTFAVVDEQDLGSGRKDFDNFSDGAIGSDDGLISADVIAFTAIEKKGVGSGVGAGANHLGREHGDRGVGVAEIEKEFETLGFGSLGFEVAIADAKLVKVGFKGFVFGVGGAKINVTGPDASDFREGPSAGALDGSHELDSPITDETDIVFALDLKGEKKDLAEDDSGQESERSMA